MGRWMRRCTASTWSGTWAPSGHPGLARVVRELEAPWSRDFDYPAREWRRLISEVFDTLLLVMVGVGAGGAVVDAVSGGQIGRGAAVTAPGPGVLAIILFVGASGTRT